MYAFSATDLLDLKRQLNQIPDDQLDGVTLHVISNDEVEPCSMDITIEKGECAFVGNTRASVEFG